MNDEQRAEALELMGEVHSCTSSSWNPEYSPRMSLLVACYKVSKYLPAFFASLDAQTSEHAQTEVIFIIDGCPENSEALVREWMEHTDYPVRLLTKPNGGVATARNAGLAVARGAWVSAPDPDDRLEPDYLREIERALTDYPNETMFVGRICFTAPDGRDLVHPLDYKNREERTRVIDLSVEPDSLHTLGPVAVFARNCVEEHHLRLREDLVTSEDADFIIRYQLAVGARYVLVPEARYRYQRRADDSSIVKTQEKNIERYRVLFGSAYPDLLEQAGTECPQWLANMLLYFIFYLFNRNRSTESGVYRTDEATLAEIRVSLSNVLRRIGTARINEFRAHNVPLDMRAAWLASADEGLQLPTPVERHDYDEHLSLLRVSFTTPRRPLPEGLQAHTSGEDGLSKIVSVKTRGIEYLDAVWAYEHVLLVRTSNPNDVWLTANPGQMFALDGKAKPVGEIRDRLGHSKPVVSQQAVLGSERQILAGVSGTRVGRLVKQICKRIVRLRYALALRIARVLGRARRYHDAVAFEVNTEQSAAVAAAMEALIRGGVESKLNGWGVVERSDPRYRSWRRDGLPVVRRGSLQHFVLMKGASAVFSHRQGAPQPFSADVLSKTWRDVYLPPEPPNARDYWHLHPWNVDVVVASSRAEYEMFTADGGCYWFNREEVLLLEGFRNLGRMSSQTGGGPARHSAAADEAVSMAVSSVIRFLRK